VMAEDQGRWDVVSRVSDVIALVGFAVPLIVNILQAHEIIAVSPDRETLIIGGVVAAILATFFLCVAVAKYYFTHQGTPCAGCSRSCPAGSPSRSAM
jgi:hypothetical protein